MNNKLVHSILNGVGLRLALQTVRQLEPTSSVNNMDEVKKANASVECPHRLAKHASTRRSRYSDSSDDRKHKAKRRKEKHKSHKKKSKRKESKVKRHKKIEAVDYIELPLQLQGQG